VPLSRSPSRPTRYLSARSVFSTFEVDEVIGL
jgi:hypothetical protein